MNPAVPAFVLLIAWLCGPSGLRACLWPQRVAPALGQRLAFSLGASRLLSRARLAPPRPTGAVPTGTASQALCQRPRGALSRTGPGLRGSACAGGEASFPGGARQAFPCALRGAPWKELPPEAWLGWAWPALLGCALRCPFKCPRAAWGAGGRGGLAWGCCAGAEGPGFRARSPSTSTRSAWRLCVSEGSARLH